MYISKFLKNCCPFFKTLASGTPLGSVTTGTHILEPRPSQYLVDMMRCWAWTWITAAVVKERGSWLGNKAYINVISTSYYDILLMCIYRYTYMAYTYTYLYIYVYCLQCVVLIDAYCTCIIICCLFSFTFLSVYLICMFQASLSFIQHVDFSACHLIILLTWRFFKGIQLQPISPSGYLQTHHV